MLFGISAMIFVCPSHAQQDAGALSGSVTDSSGAVIPRADVFLQSVDTGLQFRSHTDDRGVFIFSPIKIGNYTITVSASGFKSVTQEKVHIDIQQRLELHIQLPIGSPEQSVEVTTAPPLLQTGDGSTGEVIDTKTIDMTPLGSRNWVFMAQLTAGVAPSNGSRGQGTGDFNANGQRAEQNNFILDGVDNNSNAADFLNGGTYVVQPPPDALAQFAVETSSYSAEFGHSAGAVVNASIKSGTNQIHGDLYEYLRNEAFDTKDYFSGTLQKYRQNQFGATLGLPILGNRLFFFGYAEANRIYFSNPQLFSVPSQLERTGNFTELLNPSLTGAASRTTLYEPNSGGAKLLQCNGVQNVFCPDKINPIAQKILNLYPLPNTNNGKLYNNYINPLITNDNSVQWGPRLDWNISSNDQGFVRFSYLNRRLQGSSPLGPILDGGSYGNSGNVTTLGENIALGETHEFSDQLVNEFRFGYNYGHFQDVPAMANTDVSSQLGLGGIPYAPLNGGLPNVTISSITAFGAPRYYPANEYVNVWQALDNVTKIWGNHSFKAGANVQRIRFYTLAPADPHGIYSFNGTYTSKPGTSYTGNGVADFLADQIYSGAISPFSGMDDYRFYNAFYAQDDWKVSSRLTINLGLRYEIPQPYVERHGRQALFFPTSAPMAGSGTGVYILPSSQMNASMAPGFLANLAANNITLQYSDTPSLAKGQYTNWAPRVGFAFTPTARFVIRGGFGLFYGGLESIGGAPNLGSNYPFQFTSNFSAPTCKAGNCPSSGLTLENGFSTQLSQGLANSVTQPTLVGSDLHVKTPYSEQYNLTAEYSLTNDTIVSAGYVGNVSRHLLVYVNENAPAALIAPGLNANPYRPFPAFQAAQIVRYAGVGSYNSMQLRIKRRFSHGLSFLSTWTWSHSLDDAPTPLGSTGDSAFRAPTMIGIAPDYSNSAWDVRHRVTFNGSYEFPFGRGRQFLNHGNLLNELVGGWATTVVFRVQTGYPFTVTHSNSTANGATAYAILKGDPFKAGGTPDPTNPGITCPTKVKTLEHWYNACAFANPPNGNTITGNQVITGMAALPYLGGPRNQIYGPGYKRVDMSLFKSFATYREQSLQFRVDGFNMLNSPAFANPNNSIGTNAGVITSTRSLQRYSPDSRFFQLSLRYLF